MARRSNGKPATNETPSGQAQTVTLPALLAGGSDREFRELIAELYAFVGRLQAMRRELADALKVSVAEFGVLLGVRHLERLGRVRVRAIADHLHISAPNVTATISSLQATGWLTKRVDPDDQRAVSIALTPFGKSALDAFARECCELNDVWFRDTTRAEMLTVTGFLRRLETSYEPAFLVAKSIQQRNALPERTRA